MAGENKMQIVQTTLWWLGASGVGVLAYFLVEAYWPWWGRERVPSIITALACFEGVRWLQEHQVGPPNWLYGTIYVVLWVVVFVFFVWDDIID